MFIPADWLPLLAVLAVAVFLDVVITGGRYLHMFMSAVSGSSYQKMKTRSGTKFCGRNTNEFEVVGYVERGGKRVPRVAFLTDCGQRQVHDADDLDIPITALKAGMMAEDVDVTLRFDKIKKYQEEIDQLRYSLATATTKANTAWSNSMDFTVKLSSQMGDIKKNIGSSGMPFQPNRVGSSAWQWNQQQAEGEGSE
jgi:hypothetical protein